MVAERGLLLRLFLGLGALAGGLLRLRRFLAVSLCGLGFAGGLFRFGGFFPGGLFRLGSLLRGGLLGLLLLGGNAALGDDLHGALTAKIRRQTGDINSLRYILALHAVGFAELFVFGLQILF